MPIELLWGKNLCIKKQLFLKKSYEISKHLVRSKKILQTSFILYSVLVDFYLLDFGVVVTFEGFISLLPDLSFHLLIIDHHIVPEVERPAAHTLPHRSIENLLKEFLDGCFS